MASSSQRKRSSRLANSDDSDDSDDDELPLVSAFVSRRTTRRTSARTAQAKKKSRLEQMAALIDSGRTQLERESKIDELFQQNRELLSAKPASSDKEATVPFEHHDTNHHERHSLPSSPHQGPLDTKLTYCLGSRKTLKLHHRLRPDHASPDAKDGSVVESVTPMWATFEEALSDLNTLLLMDEQSHPSSSFAPLRQRLLTSDLTKSPFVCRTYLQNILLCQQKDPERIRYLPINFLRWLMALACGPDVRKGTAQESASVDQKIWKEAKNGAFQTLYKLWSMGLGFPQLGDEEVYLLSVASLAGQLRQWFGSTLEEKCTNQNLDAKKDALSSSPRSTLSSAAAIGTPQKTLGKTDDTRIVTNETTALFSFLRLWALALQTQINSMTTKTTNDTVTLVDLDDDDDNDIPREDCRKDVSDAIMAVLWAGLDPTFGSSSSPKDDCNSSIQTIVRCLLEYVHLDGGSNDVRFSFEDWVADLSERICETWSQRLGRGSKATDAYEDKDAWISLARTVVSLEQVGGDDVQVGPVGGSQKGSSLLTMFRLGLSRCVLKRAVSQPLEATNDGETFDALVENEMADFHIPEEKSSSQPWQAMALCCVGLDNLPLSFSRDEASKIFAVATISSVCFRLAFVELEQDIRKTFRDVHSERDNEEEEPKEDNSDVESVENRNKLALYNAFERVETLSGMVSSKCRGLIWQSTCFPFTSNTAENMRNYARLNKVAYAPRDSVAPVVQQAKISTFFQNKASSEE